MGTKTILFLEEQGSMVIITTIFLYIVVFFPHPMILYLFLLIFQKSVHEQDISDGSNFLTGDRIFELSGRELILFVPWFVVIGDKKI